MLKISPFLLIFSIHFSFLYAQPGAGYNKNYKLLQSSNAITDKNFYLLTAINKSSEIIRILSANRELTVILQSKRNLIHEYGTDTIKRAASLLSEFTWTTEDSLKINQIFKSLYKSATVPFDKLINTHLRPSGYYQRFKRLSNEDFLMHAWGQYFYGINYMIYQFGLGKKLRYPSIDSASYDTKSDYFQSTLSPLFHLLDEQSIHMKLFYEPSLQIALWLMEINDRNEPAQFEPLEKGENKATALKVGQIKWNQYPYSALVIPGEGPELEKQPLSPCGKMRCALAAERYKQGAAPFIIVSGGNCHPFHTPYNEALEMKKYLVQQFAIPTDAIIIEPQARHTTTNFRNSNRLLIRYSFPIDKPALCVTTSDQATYIADKRFDNRNQRELGYLPYRNKQSLSIHESSFFPVLECLHMDPADPLDP